MQKHEQLKEKTRMVFIALIRIPCKQFDDVASKLNKREKEMVSLCKTPCPHKNKKKNEDRERK